MRDKTLRRIALIFGGMLSAFALLLNADGEKTRMVVSDLGLILGAGVATAFCALTAIRTRGRMRVGWVFVAAACLSWTTGETLWSVYELTYHQEVPFPSWADVGYLAAIPFAAIGLLYFPSAPQSIKGQFRTLLDGMITASSLLFVSWTAVIGPLYRSSASGPLEKAIGLAYPLGDVALVSVVGFLLVRSSRSGRVPLGLLGSGIVALAFADSAFAYLTMNDKYASGNLIDIGWLAAYLLIAVGAARGVPSQETRRERPSLTGMLLPYAAVAGAIAVSAVELTAKGSLDLFLTVNAATIVLLVAGRQSVTILENYSLNRTLEQKVEERTSQLASTLGKLKESKRLQDEFISNTSHELRTPLTVILGMTQTLTRPELGLNGEVRDLVETTTRHAQRMRSLIEDLLTASSLNGERIATTSLSITAELEAAITAFHSQDKILVTQIPPGLEGLGESRAIHAILSHLLSNADKFAPEGTRVWIEAAENNDTIDVRIRDEGPGIPPESREKAFERFVQLDGSSTRSHGGVGLGLFLARQLAESIGGSLTIADSESGATFVLRLRAAPMDVSPLPSLRAIRETMSAV